MEKAFYLKIRGKNISCILHEPIKYNKKMLIICHGFGSSKNGAHGMFTELARELCNLGYQVLRFDFPCNGDSEGNFIDNDFDNWIGTLIELSRNFKYNKLAILGNSMGGTCVVHTLAKSKIADCFVTWVADPKFKESNYLDKQNSKYAEERGLRVKWSFWEDIIKKDFIKSLSSIKIPGLMIYADNDRYIPLKDILTIKNASKSNMTFKIYNKMGHAFSDYETSQNLIETTIKFIKNNLSS